eukprot:247443-Ditylum_brightwellii.AAC.1
MEITLQASPNATGGETKNNITKNCVAKFKLGNPEELINWIIWPNHVIQNKPCKLPESWFDMVEMLLGGKVLQHWCQFKSRMTALPILGVLDGDNEDDNEDDNEKKKKDKGQSSTNVGTPAGITKDTYGA